MEGGKYLTQRISTCPAWLILCRSVPVLQRGPVEGLHQTRREIVGNLAISLGESGRAQLYTVTNACRRQAIAHL